MDDIDALASVKRKKPLLSTKPSILSRTTKEDEAVSYYRITMVNVRHRGQTVVSAGYEIFCSSLTLWA